MDSKMWIAVAVVVVGLVFVGQYDRANKQKLLIEREKIEQAKAEANIKKLEIEQKGVIEAARITLDQENKEEKQKFLAACELDAMTDFDTTWRLNSDHVRGEGDDEVRRWKSVALGEQIESKLKEDKELCIKKYGD